MLATDLLLLALDDERGTLFPQTAVGLDYGLAGAVVMDLALRGCIRVDERDRAFAARPAPGDAVLDDVLRVISRVPGRPLSYWVDHLPREFPGLRGSLLARLAAQGALEMHEQQVLLHRNVYPERDALSSTICAPGLMMFCCAEGPPRPGPLA